MAEAMRMDSEYKKHYNRGWYSSQRPNGAGLDGADSRNEPESWYDGYLDYGAGRNKWHIPNCPTHGGENGNGGDEYCKDIRQA